MNREFGGYAPQEAQEPKKEPPHDYLRELDTFLRRIKWHLSHHLEEKIGFGANYHIRTNQGKELTVKSTYIDSGNGTEPVQRDFYIVALDDNGSVLGIRNQVLDMENMVAEGIIATRNPGEGVAMPLDLALNDILQRESNRLGKSIIWKVSNMNAEDLERLKRGNIRNHEQDAKIQSKAAEQQRWQALYGKGGKLGFNKDGEKTIAPDQIDEAEPEQVRISRSGNSVSVEAIPAPDPAELREQRFRELAKLVYDISQQAEAA